MPKHPVRYGVVVQGPDPLDENGDPRYTRSVDGRPIMAILAERLARVGNIAVTVMAMDTPEPATVALAQELGWCVKIRGAGFPGWSAGTGLQKTGKRTRKPVAEFVRIRTASLANVGSLTTSATNPFLRPPGWRMAAAGLRGLLARYWLLVDLEWPFLDPDETRGLLERMHADGTRTLWIEQANGPLPRAVVRRDVGLGALLKKLVRRRAPGPFSVARQAARDGETSLTIPTVPPVAECLGVDALTTETVQRLGGTHLSIASLTAAQQDESCVGDVLWRARRRLDARMQNSPAPHVWNRKLNRLESRNECADVRSFPLDVALNLTTRCNARCVFCDYPHLDGCGQRLALADIRQMTWLKYVSKLGFGGGIGDPLMHPEFLEILDHVTQTYPHLATRVITNGLGLTPKVCDAFAGNLARLRISLNAASRDTWETVMRTRGFERICDSVSRLARLKKQRGTDKPEIWLMMVVNALNVDEVVPLVDLAGKLGAQFVNYNHFSRSVMCRCDLSEGDSPYFDRERCDAALEQAAERAKALGIGIDYPPPFDREVPIFEAARVDRAAADCYAPWQQCMLTGDDDARQVCLCCVGVGTTVYYEKQDLTEDGFRRLWNDPILQHVRSTANASQPNPMCRFCRTVDRHDPANQGMCRVEQIDFVPNHPSPVAERVA